MPMQHVNWAAIVVAAIASFLLGGLWYSPALFGRAWQSANNLSDDDLRKRSMGMVFGVSFVLTLLMAANLAMFLADPKTTVAWGATAGFLAGFGWVGLAIAILALFERRSWKYIAINAGYMTAAFVMMGLILGAWRR